MTEPDIDVDHVAHLARLDLPAAERARMQAELRSILGYVNRLQELDTAAVEATFQVVPRVNVLRADAPAPGLDVEAALRNAPAREDGCFRMPRILEG